MRNVTVKESKPQKKRPGVHSKNEHQILNHQNTTPKNIEGKVNETFIR